MFQSRNRDAFDFKSTQRSTRFYLTSSFNLVIEMLLISSPLGSLAREREIEFQSRNRDAFDFKTVLGKALHTDGRSFNLVIEMLLISS